jgi:dTDP-4-amino-4,6-dideoxygalactose transaminase
VIEMPVDFNRPLPIGKEREYVLEAMQSGHISGDGPFTKKCHALLQEALGVPQVLLTTSCTHALEMAALLLRIEPGDEVVFPDFTFVSTVNAFVLRGARPVFVDIRADTLNLDEKQLAGVLGPKTRAIVPVHYAGIGCEMDMIMAEASRRGIAVVEDNAHGLFGKFKGRYLGTFGVLAAQSFHETKNFSSGEGGALIINDDALRDRAEIIREKGTNRSRFFRGQIDKYTWVDVGSSYLPSDILAAYLFGQLEARERIQSVRRNAWNTYAAGLREWAAGHEVRLPYVPDDCEQPFHMFYLLLPNLELRTRFIAHLRERGVYAVFHYLPLHLSDMGRSFGGREGQCPVTERVSDQMVRLPLHNLLTGAEQEEVIEAILDFAF